MKPARMLALLCATAALSAATSLYAQSNLGFLHDTPMTFLQDRDSDALYQSVANVAEHNRDGQTTRWTNEGMGNPVVVSAAITPQKTVKTVTQTCRDLVVVLYSKGQKQAFYPNLCRTADGKWQLTRR
ncbi:MAG: hypothetical protein KGK15_13800 [Burkholderiales bacterium]|nr:hypothetical protein [Burkholderiales bacterium]MDE2289327.1 hypothetical protein [Burkholderiales bacterium]MDE2610352.1 hypothetical protein [Burkholderiales bacterium]